MTIYPVLLIFHNLTRWLVLAVGLWVTARLWLGWRTHQAWQAADRTGLRVFAWVISIQCVFGLGMYLLPNTFVNASLNALDLAVIMKNSVLRFFVLEHPLQMFIAIGISHWCNWYRKHIQPDTFRLKCGALIMTMVMLIF
ncbi:MAG: hypothetical protein WCL57_12380 [Chloroflexota bacterium]|jgi:hypothetical protein|nr:hypothetical protein [Chloroflexota bacterium]